jgi:hypothetical protein
VLESIAIPTICNRKREVLFIFCKIRVIIAASNQPLTPKIVFSGLVTAWRLSG